MKKEYNDNTLLEVSHLSQHFKFRRFSLKAVNDVSFDIKKGEVFGLVGESGCGKTTTGRTIIKLYKATGGDVYFKGERIVAGPLEHKKAIQEARLKAKAGQITAEELSSIIKEERKAIKDGRYEQNHCNAQYVIDKVNSIKAEYEPRLKELENNPAELRELKKEYRYELSKARKERLVNEIQMNLK